MVRGGAFNNNRNNVRCAVRNRNNPNNDWNNNGFRVVSHGFPAVWIPEPNRARILRRLRLAQRGETAGAVGSWPSSLANEPGKYENVLHLPVIGDDQADAGQILFCLLKWMVLVTNGFLQNDS